MTNLVILFLFSFTNERSLAHLAMSSQYFDTRSVRAHFTFQALLFENSFVVSLLRGTQTFHWQGRFLYVIVYLNRRLLDVKKKVIVASWIN